MLTTSGAELTVVVLFSGQMRRRMKWFAGLAGFVVLFEARMLVFSLMFGEIWKVRFS